jgi:hypothetical protein
VALANATQERGERDVSKPKDDTVAETAGDDSVAAPVAADHAAACEAAGLNPDEVQPGDPALTGVSRDERHDSIDPHTGGLTDEAVQLRAGRAAE